MHSVCANKKSFWSLIYLNFQKHVHLLHNSLPQSTVSENNPMQEAGRIVPKEKQRAPNALHTVGSCICMLDYCNPSVRLLLFMHFCLFMYIESIFNVLALCSCIESLIFLFGLNTGLLCKPHCLGCEYSHTYKLIKMCVCCACVHLHGWAWVASLKRFINLAQFINLRKGLHYQTSRAWELFHILYPQAVILMKQLN